jgi:hypothetical protein
MCRDCLLVEVFPLRLFIVFTRLILLLLFHLLFSFVVFLFIGAENFDGFGLSVRDIRRCTCDGIS